MNLVPTIIHVYALLPQDDNQCVVSQSIGGGSKKCHDLLTYLYSSYVNPISKVLSSPIASQNEILLASIVESVAIRMMFV